LEVFNLLLDQNIMIGFGPIEMAQHLIIGLILKQLTKQTDWKFSTHVI
jgi:hypothetical protein